MKYRFLSASVFALMIATPAMAQTAAAAPSSIDLTTPVNAVIGIAFTVCAGLLVRAAHGILDVLNRSHVLQQSLVSNDLVDSSIARAVDYVKTQIEGVIDPHVSNVSVKNAVIANAARIALDTAPAAFSALGLTQDTIAAKINRLVTPVTQPASTPADAPSAATSVPA